MSVTSGAVVAGAGSGSGVCFVAVENADQATVYRLRTKQRIAGSG